MKIGIIGTGAYAIALASILENKNYKITMWTALKEEYEELKSTRKNLKALDYELKKDITFTMNMQEVIENNEAIILAIPAKFIETTVSLMKNYLTNQEILIATKGIETKNKSLIHDYLEKVLKTTKIACISGPSFAKEVITKEPIGLTLASQNSKTLNYFLNLFKDIPYLTIELREDIIGVELCGILKNIMAIFSGILDGLNITYSTNAKFLMDASYEIRRIIKEFGGDKHTFSTYAGMGDLILTCTSVQSRNYTFGKLIGEGADFKSYQAKTTIEGLENLNAMYELLKEKNIESEVIDILYKIVYQSQPKELVFEFLKNKTLRIPF